MIAPHARFVTDAAGQPVEVLVPIAEWNRLCAAAAANEDDVVRRWQAGELSAGTAARLLGVSYAEYIRVLARRGLSLIDHSAEELERELAGH